MFEYVFTTAGLGTLLTLSFLEVVLGVDNIIFISIISDRLPEKQQNKARVIGLLLSLIMRIFLLLGIVWMASATNPLFTIFKYNISFRDLILFSGGIFLLINSIREIYSKVIGKEDKSDYSKVMTLKGAIFQIVLLDVVFSFDSILTAVGLTRQIIIMITAVIIAMVVMLTFAKKVSDFINQNPTIKMLALAFLLMIGGLLVLESFHIEVPKEYIYFSIIFSLTVEILNLQVRNKRQRKLKS